MLRNLGLLWLADAAPTATEQALAIQAGDEQGGLADALSSTIGATHLQASQHLFRAWGLPADLLDACERESTSPIASICRLSSNAAVDVYMGTTRCSTDADKIKTHLAKSAERILSIAQSISS
jgi:HD-like signal output (HDOD) protein